MLTPPPVLVLLDISALMSRNSREWEEYSHIGTCYVPQVAYEEIEFLTGRATEPEIEKVAREFMRFFPNSGWEITNTHATHPAITPPAGSNLSKQARLVVSIAQCAYGFALEQTDSLVVFVSNTQSILQRIPSLGSPNFCGVTRAAFLQWVRTGEQPPAVTQQIQIFSSSAEMGSNNGARFGGETSKSAVASPAPTMTGPASADRAASSQSRSRRGGTGVLSRAIASLVSLFIVAVLGLAAWRLIQPASFDRFWKQIGLPALPGQPHAQPSKPAKK